MRKIIWLLIAVVSIAAVACGSATEEADTVPAQSAEPATAPAPAAPAPAPVAAVAPAPAPTSATPETARAAPAPTVGLPAPVQPAPSAAPPPQPAPVAVESADGRTRGGTFNRLWADPPTLDPHLTTDTTSAGVVVELFSGLVTLNTDLQLVPDIAEGWDISADGTVYTFHLRPNAKFHDGKQITASDFKWSIERAVSPDTASPVVDTYLDDIVGVNDALEGLTADVSGRQGHRRSHAADNDRRGQGLFPGEADLSYGLRAGPGERGGRWAKLDRQTPMAPARSG